MLQMLVCLCYNQSFPRNSILQACLMEQLVLINLPELLVSQVVSACSCLCTLFAYSVAQKCLQYFVHRHIQQTQATVQHVYQSGCSLFPELNSKYYRVVYGHTKLKLQNPTSTISRRGEPVHRDKNQFSQFSLILSKMPSKGKHNNINI